MKTGTGKRINFIINKYNYRSYLEVGMHRGHTFGQVQAHYKVGIDICQKANGRRPTYLGTSDDFFLQNEDHFDIIFIDALHHADQVMRDITNSLKYLNKNGMILCHDVIPKAKNEQIVPQPPSSVRMSAWTGDVWKAWVKLRATREDLWMKTITGGVGLGVIRRGKQNLLPLSRKLIDPSYEDFCKNRKQWLNVVTWDEFVNDLA